MHWKHSRYQIINVILANCHTYDEAYRVLRELEEDYVLSIDLALVESKRAEAKNDQSKELLDSTEETVTRFELIRAEADIMEIKARTLVSQECLNVARTTLEFIRKILAFVDSRRTYKHLTDAEAHQCSQPLEWRLDLTWKAYNMICATGNLSYDHFINIKMLPNNEKVTSFVTQLIDDVRNGKHSDILKLTKKEVFSRVVFEGELFIQDKLETLIGDTNVYVLGTPISDKRIEKSDK